MRQKIEGLAEVEAALIGKWIREDNQFFLFFVGTTAIGETGKIRSTEQEAFLEITPPFEYKVELGEIEEGGWPTWLYIIDNEKETVNKYQIWFLSEGLGKMELINEQDQSSYFYKWKLPAIL